MEISLWQNAYNFSQNRKIADFRFPQDNAVHIVADLEIWLSSVDAACPDTCEHGSDLGRHHPGRQHRRGQSVGRQGDHQEAGGECLLQL